MATDGSDFEAIWGGANFGMGATVSQPCPHPKFETMQNLENYIYFIEI
jgi:hypothetical protein